MFKSEQNWLLPLFLFLLLVGMGFALYPHKPVWYDQIEDFQISSIEATELAGWIIEGRNDFLVFSLDTAAQTNNIPGLVPIKDLNQLETELKAKPNYKKWVMLTGPGGIPPQMAAQLTQDRKRRVMLVEGGGAAWQEQISAEAVDWSRFDLRQTAPLPGVRPFFHRSAEPNQKQQSYIAPKATAPPFLQAAPKKVALEGC